MNTFLPVENGDTLKSLQGFFKTLLESKTVEAILLPMRTPAGSISPALVVDPSALASADPLAPVMTLNTATLAGKLSVKEPRPKVGVVLRSCEARALIELTKMQQANLANLVIISIDCAGTTSVPDYVSMNGKRADLWTELFQQASGSPESPPDILRQACKMCEQPVYNPRPEIDISIQLFGCDIHQQIGVTLPAELAQTLGLQSAEPNPDRAGTIDKLVAARISARDEEFAAIRLRLEDKQNGSTSGLQTVFAACIRCHNCMNVCPICYCKTCVFKSHIFDHEPDQYVKWAQSKGAFRMPSDTMLFHLTRLNHMVLSCVGCGMCTEACPAELPVGTVFRAIGQKVQETFEYLPGRSAEEPLPLVTFKADEWTEVGE